MLFQNGNSGVTPSLLFMIGFLISLSLGVVIYNCSGNSTIDIHLHDTYIIIANFQIVWAFAIILGVYAALYHWFPKMFGRYLNNTMAHFHFWVTMIGAYLMFWPMHYQGLAGVPRRYLDYSNWESFNQFAELNKFISTVAMVVFAVQLVFIFNFFYSIFKGRKVANNKNQ